MDPESGEEVSLFDPRHDTWPEHFRWNGFVLVGLTAVGRATIAALRMNRPLIPKPQAQDEPRARGQPP